MAAYSCGVYRSSDSLSNFKIRVRLEKRSSSSIVPAPGPSGPTSSANDPQNGLELRDFTAPGSPSKDPVIETDEYVFSWQEKILSKNECDVYSDEKNCHNPQQTKYNEMTKKLKNEKRPTKWLFTYVDGDDIPDYQAAVIGTQIKQRKTTSIQATNTESLRRRKTSLKTSGWNRGGGGGRDFSHVNIVNENLTEMQRKLWHSVTTPSQTMHIMAELQSHHDKDPGGDDRAEEVVLLCTVRVTEQGVIYMEPDFRQKPPYEVEIKDLGKEVYRYTLALASQPMSDEQREQERTIQREVYSRRATQLLSLVGHDFETVPMDTFRMHVFGEIVSAQNFEYDNLYVNFCLEVPQNWLFEGGDQPIYGTTQTTRAKVVEEEDDIGRRTEICHFGHLFAYLMSCKTDQFCQASFSKWPQLLIQVMSRDTWNRFRTEGYGYINIPSQPGCHTFNVSTWRPLTPNTQSDQLRRFFIGGSPDLEDLADIAVGSTQEGKVLSKYGLETITTGTVTIRFQTVQQSERFLLNESRMRDNAFSRRIRSTSTLRTSVEAVLEAFHRARQRMLAARENLNF